MELCRSHTGHNPRRDPSKIEGYAWHICFDRYNRTVLNAKEVQLQNCTHLSVLLVIFENPTDRKNTQLTRSALEATEQSKAHFIAEVGNGEYNPGHFVFVDESPYNLLTIRRRMGQSPIGTRASRRDKSNRGVRYSTTPQFPS